MHFSVTLRSDMVIGISVEKKTKCHGLHEHVCFKSKSDSEKATELHDIVRSHSNLKTTSSTVCMKHCVGQIVGMLLHAPVFISSPKHCFLYKEVLKHEWANLLGLMVFCILALLTRSKPNRRVRVRKLHIVICRFYRRHSHAGWQTDCSRLACNRAMP